MNNNKEEILKKVLTTNGNTWQLYLTKTISELLGITSDEYTVEFKITNKTLYVKRSKYKSSLNKTSQLKLKKGILIRKLIRRGAGFGLNLPLSVLELLEINPEKDSIDVTIEGDKLIIKKFIT